MQPVYYGPLKAIRTYNKRKFSTIRDKQCKYLNNRIEGDHRFIKWRTQQMLSFKNFKSAQRTLKGIELVRMIKEEQGVFAMATS
jgi:putative transposase